MVNSIFQNVQGLKPRRRAYNMSYRNDFTTYLGTLTPVYFQDTIPNTSIFIRVHGLVRFLPMIAPIMDNIDMYCHFWQGPRRILEGEQFTDMITGETPDDEINLPYWTPDAVFSTLRNSVPVPSGADSVTFWQTLVKDGSIFDMLGYDKTLFGDYAGAGKWTSSTGKLNARKFIFYARLLCQWYINENVEPWDDFVANTEEWCNPKNEVKGDISVYIGGFIAGLYNTFGVTFFCHGWQKDYFTSALPSLQYGEPVYLPLGSTAPVRLDVQDVSLSTPFLVAPQNTDFVGGSLEVSSGSDSPFRAEIETASGSYLEVDVPSLYSENISSINGEGLIGTADLTEATAITINELRLSNALQVFKEREMKFGRRAPEHYKGYYGVRPRDMRLQIPEYIGGGRMPVNISDIEQTSQTTESSPQGNLSGKGTGIAGGFATARCFTPEESCIMGLAFFMPKVTYANLLSRHDTKLNDRFEYYNPSFAHIGEQEVYNYELYAGSYGTDAGNQEFGYQPRYTEYRFHANEVHGDFKDSLSFWTLGRIFTQQPTLNASFIYMNPKTLNRIFAVQTNTMGQPSRNVLCSLKFDVSLVQPLSRYGTPSLIV